ncbi:MAG: DUF6529 family protein [Nocardioidaceae bacterium]
MTTQVPAIQPSAVALTGVVLAGAAVAVALGVYGREHTPTGQEILTFGFGSLIAMKVWLSVIVSGFVVVQGVTALWMYGRLGVAAPAGLARVHKTSGALAILVSLPVAYHCLWSLGFQTYDRRVLVHSLAGCLFYGAFVSKVLSLHGRRLPGWLVPLLGGLVFTAIVVVVLTSAGWYVREFGWPSSSTGY